MKSTKSVSNHAISAAVEQLKQEHIRLCKELARVDEALSALGGLGGVEVPAKGKAAKVAPAAPRAKRKISAAARKKMSEAARARWAARRKEAAKPAKG
jgi:hypothetical protein